MTRLDLTTFTDKRSDAWSGFIVAMNLFLVLMPLYVSAWLGFGLYLLPAWVWCGVGMNGLLNLMHECAHSHVFRGRTGSMFLGRWVLGPLALADFDAYQKRHWIHHRHLGEGDDPKYVYRVNVRGRRFLSFTVRCACVWEAVKKFSGQAISPNREGGGSTLLPRLWAMRVLLVQSLLAGSILWVATDGGGRPLGEGLLTASAVYGGVYLYGLASLTVWVAGLRAIAEHQITGDQAVTQKDAALRNFRPGRLLSRLLGSYGFVQHATHHYEPAIPYYRLPDATAVLARTNPSFSPAHTYGSVLAAAIRSRHHTGMTWI